MCGHYQARLMTKRSVIVVMHCELQLIKSADTQPCTWSGGCEPLGDVDHPKFTHRAASIDSPRCRFAFKTEPHRPAAVRCARDGRPITAICRPCCWVPRWRQSLLPVVDAAQPEQPLQSCATGTRSSPWIATALREPIAWSIVGDEQSSWPSSSPPSSA
jgi:hypothetical protein